MPARREYYYIDCDNLIKYVGMHDAADAAETPITTATVTAALYNESDDTELVAATSMPHVSAGLYQGTIDKDAPDPALTRGQKLYVKIVATDSGKDDGRRIPHVAVYRGEE